MKKINKIIKVAVYALALGAVLTGTAFAAACTSTSVNQTYADLQVAAVNPGSVTAAPANFPVKCSGGTGSWDNTTKYEIYGASTNACAKAGSIISDPADFCNKNLNTTVNAIINTVIFIIGMLAVVMIIIGGVNYAMSQGDPGKVKKAKDTILYGIIGLVVALLAFAIVQFILNSL